MVSVPSVIFDSVSCVVRTVKREPFAILRDFSMRVAAGSFVCLVGNSGCGKTTVINLAAGFIEPMSGQVRFVGSTDPGQHDAARSDANDVEMVRGDIQPAVCFQVDTTFAWMTCEQNLRFALNHGRVTSDPDRKLDEMLQLTGLTAFARFYPGELSGGMRKRLELGRSWLSGSPVLLLDEPLGQLDQMTRIEMQEMLQALWLREPRTIIMVTHDQEEALYLADEVAIMGGPPGRLARTMRVPFERPRRHELRFDVQFQDLRRELEQSLKSASPAIC